MSASRCKPIQRSQPCVSHLASPLADVYHYVRFILYLHEVFSGVRMRILRYRINPRINLEALSKAACNGLMFQTIDICCLQSHCNTDPAQMPG